MKKLIFLGVGIVLLVVVAAVGMSLVSGGGDDSEEVAAKPEEPKAPAVPLTIEMRPMSVPLVRDGDVVRYVILTAKYDLLARPDQISDPETARPTLRDAIVRAVHADPIKVSGDTFDQSDLEARFRASAERVFDAGVTQTVEVGEAQASKPAAQAPKPAPKKDHGDDHH